MLRRCRQKRREHSFSIGTNMRVHQGRYFDNESKTTKIMVSFSMTLSSHLKKFFVFCFNKLAIFPKTLLTQLTKLCIMCRNLSEDNNGIPYKIRLKHHYMGKKCRAVNIFQLHYIFKNTGLYYSKQNQYFMDIKLHEILVEIPPTCEVFGTLLLQLQPFTYLNLASYCIQHNSILKFSNSNCSNNNRLWKVVCLVT